VLNIVRKKNIVIEILRQNVTQSSEFTPTQTSNYPKPKEKVYYNPKEKRRKDFKRHLKKLS
jgi:hypothetical protein